MDQDHAFVRLARAHGLQAGYTDYNGVFRGADRDILGAVLRALGADVDGDPEDGLAAREREH